MHQKGEIQYPNDIRTLLKINSSPKQSNNALKHESHWLISGDATDILMTWILQGWAYK